MIRPPERPLAPTPWRPVAPRTAVRKPVSMDGMKPVGAAHKSLLSAPALASAPTPKPVEASEEPKQAPAPIVPEKPKDITTIENTPVEVPPTVTIQQAMEKEIKKEDGKPVKQGKLGALKKRLDLKKAGLIGLAVIVLAVTAYISIDTWFTNQKAQAIAGTNVPAASSAAHTKEAEGKDESDVAPETLADYVVSPEYPRALYIDKLGVAARVLPMSINTDGSVQSPLNIFDSGWYTGSVKPGEIGAAFIDGHASGATRQGLFGSLDTLVVGDTIKVEKGDGKTLTFKVTHLETIPLEGLDMRKVLLPHGNSLRALNLMTCTGEWLEDKQTFDHRVIVYTELVQE